ncbi:AlpA family transcriptional regulator [Escherichia coli]
MSNQTGQLDTPSRILRMAELTRLLGISRSTIYVKINPAPKYHDPTFPKPIRLASASVGWRASAIDEWLTLHTAPAWSEPENKQKELNDDDKTITP